MTKPNRGKCLGNIDQGILEILTKAVGDADVQLMLMMAKRDICPSCSLYLMTRTMIAEFDNAAKDYDFADVMHIVTAAIGDHFDHDVDIKVIQ